MTVMESKTRYLSVTETAQLVRQLLKRKFPAIKFSVRSKSYSGGASINIGWTDGVRAKVIESYVKGFEGKSFDGMNDLASYQEGWLLPNGTGELASRPDSYGGSIPAYVSDAPHPNAQLVHFGADYIFCNRHVSDFDNKEKQALDYIRLHCHCEGVPPNDRFGNDWVSNLARGMAWDWDDEENIEQVFNRVVLRQ